MRALTVLSVAYPFAAVSGDSVGGAEQIVAALDAALTRAGHRSIVVACEESAVAGELIALSKVPELIDEAARARAHEAVRAAVSRCRADVIHLHGVDFAAYVPPRGPPVLATVHLPPEWYPQAALRSGVFLNAVSAAQDGVLRGLADPARVLAPIPNGVAVAALGASRHARRGFALALGRLCPEKGQHVALDAARMAGMALLIAGSAFPYPAHQDYVRDEILPRLDARRRLIGPVGFARKRRLLSAARCVLIPSLAAETSSLVAMEAAACGTPVIAFATGALPEIVEDGITGFLVADGAAMADAIGRAHEIDPEACRRVARARFSVEAMTAAYLRLYGAARLVRVVTDDAGLRELAPEWAALWRRVGVSPFQSPAWMLAWWGCFGNARPVVAVARTGLLACYLLDGILLPMGAGTTDYQDVLGGSEEGLLGAVLDAAVACDLTDLPPDAALRSAPVPRGWRESLRESDPCPVLSGPIPSGRRRDIRQACHRAGRRGGWRVEVADADTLDHALAAFERLHALRWPAEDARVIAFRRLAAPALLSEGALRLALLRIAGEVAAGCYALLAPGRLLLYVSGFDPRFAYESPGTILLGWLIERASAEGRAVHFLRGNEGYKTAWGGVARINATRRLVRA